MMISDSITAEASFLLISVLSGAGLIIFYDFFRVLRRIVPHGVFWLAVEDTVYWILCAVFVFAMLYQENDGLLRGFAIGGVMIGMITYNHFVSPVLIKYISRFFLVILKILKKMLKILIKPFRKIKKLLKKLTRIVKMGLCKL